MDLGKEHFARGIERRLNEIPRARTIPLERRSAIAHGLAGSLFSLLTWWVQTGMNVLRMKWTNCFIDWFGLGPMAPCEHSHRGSAGEY